MLKSHWVMAARVLRRHKLFTAINVAGLALGIACATLIGLYVAHEIGYDRFWASADRIVRISDDVLEANLHFAGTAPIVALLLENSFPEVRRSARLSTCFGRTGGGLVTVGAKSFYERNLAAADNALFEIFDFKWLAGDARTALAGPRAAVITQSAARRYFGTANALGRTFGLETMDGPFEVTGVIGDLPDNTHLEFDLLISLQGAPPRTLESWSGNCYQTYALLGRAEDAAVLRSGSAQFFEERLGKGSSRFRGFSVVAIADIHLHSKREGEMRPPGSMTSVRAFGAIALFVLAIACINYVNLATARAAQRAREVGIRRIVGAKSRQLVAQFLGESVLVTVVAVAAAAALVAATLPLFASFVDKDIRLRDLGSQGFALLGLAALVVALVAGSYPAFGLAAFRPARVLRGGVAGGGKAAAVRKALVVFQFAISIALVVVTLVVFEQTRYARNLDPGYDTDQILVLTASPAKGLGPQWEAMRRQWLQLPEVRAVTASNVTPGTRSPARVLVKPPRADGFGFVTTMMPVDFDFFSTYEIPIVAGRPLSEGRGDRRVLQLPDAPSPAPTAFVLSELAVERLGWTPEEAVGRTLDVSGPGIVVGVAADVHLESVRDAITPVAYAVPPAQSTALHEASIRITGRDLERTLASIDAIWRRFETEPVARRFLDQDFEELYRGERRQGQMLTLFSLLAITIACLGLFGLASFAAVRRTKEVGIRKALGASVADIVRLFVSEFALLALLANVVAWPLAYVVAERWLAGFAYRIELRAFVFVASGALALVLAALTVAAVTRRAARARPVSALRYE